jgi:DNA-binding PadR family transcriptional regulator
MNRFASRGEIGRNLIGLKEGYNLYRRLRHLQRIGLIELLTGDGETTLGYRLTRRGVKFARRNRFLAGDAVHTRPAFKTQFDHDQIVNEAKQILSTSPIVTNFIAESELRSRIGKSRVSATRGVDHEWKVPDAMFTLSTSRGSMTTALEVELTQKAKARYSKIVATLLTSKSFEFVFFICRDEKLKALIRNQIAKARATNALVRASNRSNGIYFCKLTDLRTKGLDAVWEGEDTRFSINELASAKRESLIPAVKTEVSQV